MSIAMKRFLKATFWLLFIVFDIVGLAALINSVTYGQFTVNTEEFQTVVEYGDDVELSDIKIIDNRVFGLVETTLNEDMIVSIENVGTSGRKKIVFEHNNKQYTVTFDVKYKVEFLSYGEVIDTQLVYGKDELVLPTPKPKDHYDFIGWDYDFSKGIDGNVQANAVYGEIEYPTLSPLTATYGDTLDDLTLPANDRGRWEFVYPAETPVGDAGHNTFSVKFVFNDGEGKDYYKFDTVELDVAKRQLDFTVDTKEFVYDGKAHFPTYTLPEDVKVITVGNPYTLPGVYEFGFIIDDNNHTGEYTSSFEITRPTVTVTVSSHEITYPAGVPEFTFTVEGFDNSDNILGIEVLAPQFATAGAYEIDISYTNTNVDYVINKGILLVHKGNQEIVTPKHSEATYGDKLSDIELLGSYQGTWSWENPDRVIDTMNGITAWAIFKHADENYNDVRVEINVTGIKKKTLTINIPAYSYTFKEGTEYSLPYELVGLVGSDNAASINLIGNDKTGAAGNHRRTLYIDDPRYDGSLTTELKIAKAVPVTDFTVVYEKIWSEGLTLGDIALPDGYEWVNPDYVITAGEHSCAAIYTPDDTNDYECVDGEFTVKVGKAPLQIEGILSSYDKSYDGKKIDIKNSGIIAKYTDKSPVITYVKNGVEVDEILNQGTYTVIISVDEGENYLGKTVEITVVISAIDNTEQVKTSQTVSFSDTIAKLELPEGVEGSWSWQESELGDAGTKTFTAIYTPDENGNYNERKVQVTVTVNKIAIDVPSIPDKPFTGEEIDTGYRDTDVYTVSGDITATYADSYSVTFTLRNPTNFEWVGYEKVSSVTRTYKISKALNTWETKPANKSVIYDGNPVYIDAKGTHGVTDVVYTLNGVEVKHPTEVGVYIATVTVTDPNYDMTPTEVTLTITQATVIAPTDVTKNFVYNKTEQGITFRDPYGKLDVLYEIDSEIKGTNAGDTLTLVLKLKDSHNYKWDTVTTDTVTFTGAITKHTVSFKTATTMDKSVWTYLDAEGTVTAGAIDDTSAALGITAEVLYSYNGGTFVTLDKLARTAGKLNAGTYTVKTVVGADTNWDTVETATVTFTVNKATPNKVVASFSDSKKDANGHYYKNLIKAPTYTVYYTYGEGEVMVELTSCTYGISALGFAGADTEYTFRVTPKDTVNFTYAEIDTTVPFVVVATIGTTMYGSIEDALEKAKSGDTVFVKTNNSGDVYINSDAVIKSGVTLVIPYGDATDASGRNQDNVATKKLVADDTSTPDINESKYYVMANTLPDEYRMNWVKIAPNVTLTVVGTLEISGEITGGGGGHMSGHTAGKYATLELCDKAEIVVDGTVKCYGFIENVSGNGEGKITLNSTATIYMPFVLYDFKGGTIMSGIYYDMSEHQTAPFHQFGFPNVSVLMRFNYGASLVAICNLEAGGKTNHTDATFIGSTEKCFLQLTDLTYSYFEAKYDPDTKITDLNIYGGARLNSFSLTVGTTLGSVTVSSSDFVFGLTWLYDITLDNNEENESKKQNKATFTMPDSYKLMPGGKLTVEDGAILEVGLLTVYDNSFVDRLSGYQANVGVYPTAYPSTSSYHGTKLESGRLTVRGILNATTLAGNVYADADGAVIKVTGATSKTTYEPTVVNKSGITGKAEDWQQITQSLKLIYGNEITDIVLNSAYISAAGNWVPGIDYITIQIPEGIEYSIGQTVVIDEYGNTSYGGAVSGVADAETFITIERGAKVTLTLAAGVVISDSDGLVINSVAEFNKLAQERTVDIQPTSDGLLVLYTVPLFNLSANSVTECTVRYYNLGKDSVYAEIVLTMTHTEKGKDVTVSIKFDDSFSGEIWSSTSPDASGKYTVSATDTASVSVTITLRKDDFGTSISATGEKTTSGGCVTPDTLITLADGTQVRVDELKGDELLLVWNLEEGKFDFAPIMFIDSEALAELEVVNLYFSDGTVVKVIYEHGFWDYDLNRYVYLDKNASAYIGHYFAKQSGDELVRVQLVDVEVVTETTTAWSPVTVGHLCYFVNGMLSMPGGVGGLFNIFEVDAETMTYDREAMAKDIEQYGLYTYEEMNAICPLSEDMFYAAGGAYLKISIAKGNLTVEELIAMIERYSIYV